HPDANLPGSAGHVILHDSIEPETGEYQDQEAKGDSHRRKDPFASQYFIYLLCLGLNVKNGKLAIDGANSFSDSRHQRRWIARCSNFVSHPLAHPVQFLYLLLERVIHDWLRSFSKVLIYAVFDDADDLKGTSPLGAIELEVLADRHVVIEDKPDKC